KSAGLSAVTMPTALTQPPQLGSHAIQLNFIGSFRSSSVDSARAAPPSIVKAGNAMQMAAAPVSTKPRRSNDFTTLNLVPSPQAPRLGTGSGNGPSSTPHDSAMRALSKR